MSAELSTYRKFIYKDDALELIKILEENHITYELANNSSQLDSSFGGDINTKQFELKIQKEDFEVVEKLEEELVKADVENAEEDYHLFDYSDEELIEIVTKKEEWNKFDYLLALKILKQRGKEINPELLKVINKQRIESLSTQEESPTWLIIIGYASAFFAGFLGIFIGGYLMYYKKALPNGDRIYGFERKDRNHGQNILILSGAAFLIWIGFNLFR
ncbi:MULTISPECIES: hypothetical protein [Chryseobacterium]|jgi:hypothetical protein|uniref:Uncharacterized protein n=1 Tax=Chryseobacterium piscium TaxID=333702 RepID=A0A3D9BLW5_9FLAO|nr:MULTISPECIES: hypothetical protein [Chryseobacterium]REC45758.1 hypothetical protein DRF69_01180 [Chryseobacterium sp. 5_R23647]REC54523.1 hypothetical protein DRF62_09385 [Chryseobacterium piscium]